MFHRLVLPATSYVCASGAHIASRVMPLFIMEAVCVIPLVVIGLGWISARIPRLWLLWKFMRRVALPVYTAGVVCVSVAYFTGWWVFPPGTCAYAQAMVTANSPVYPGAAVALARGIKIGRLKCPGIMWADAHDDALFLQNNNFTLPHDVVPLTTENPWDHKLCGAHAGALHPLLPVDDDTRNQCMIMQSAYRVRARAHLARVDHAAGTHTSAAVFYGLARVANSVLCMTIPDAGCLGTYAEAAVYTPCQWVARRARRAFGKSLGERLIGGKLIDPDDTSEQEGGILASAKNMNSKFVRKQLASVLRTGTYFVEQLVCDYELEDPARLWVTV